MSDGPLAGRRILVTRPAGQSEPLCSAIEAAGGEAVRFPVMRIVGRARDEVSADIAAGPVPDLAIFVSANAVDHGLFAIADGTRIAAIGPATAAAVERAGREVAFAAGGAANSEALLGDPALADPAGLDVLIVRGQDGRPKLGRELAARGAAVRYVAAYRREPAQPDPADLEALDADLRHGNIDAVVVMSAESLRFMLDLLPVSARERLRSTPLVAPGERVIQTAAALVPGIPAVAADGPGPAKLLNALIKALGAGRSR